MLLILPYILYAIVGMLSGVLAGLLGISGGLITVPCLFIIFKFTGLPQEFLMHMAIGTSLAAMVFNSFSSALYHHKKGSVLWTTAKKMLGGIIIGSIIGALIAHVLSGVILEIIFGLFALILGVRFFRNVPLKEGDARLPSTLALNGIGIGIGGLSNILGIGGGVVTVPILLHYQVSAQKAIGTSAATGFIITLIGAIAYLLFGLQHKMPVESIGYVNLPAFFVISIVSFLFAPFGVKLAHKLPTLKLRCYFGVVLIFTGLSMIFF